MANVLNGVEILPKISIAWVGYTNVTNRQTTDDRQTDGRRHSERQREFTFAKNASWRQQDGLRLKIIVKNALAGLGEK